MKIQYCSDLHLEFNDNLKWLRQNPIIPRGDILIIAGDTYYMGQDFSKQPFFDILSEQFNEVFLIPGNHEYYGGYDVAKSIQGIDEKIRHNVRLVHNKAIAIEGIQFIFTTLWSQITRNAAAVLMGMLDFRKIRHEHYKLNISQYNALHDNAMLFLLQALKENICEKTIVVTHHLPSELCNVEEFKDSKLNEAFCVDLTGMIEQNTIDYWLYGHSHRNKTKFEIGNTTMITNQLGYVGYGEHASFNREAWIEV